MLTTTGRGRGLFRTHGRGRGRGRSYDSRQKIYNNQGNNKKYVQCFNYKKTGHVKSECWYKDKNAIVVEGIEETNLFMAHNDISCVTNSAWLIDSRCSNHMTGKKELFRDLDETKKLKVKLGDDKEIQVEGEGTVAISNSPDKVKLLHNVQYVPSLAHNLISVGQLLLTGYSVNFSNEACYIMEMKTGQQVLKVQMTTNRMFPIEVSSMVHFGLIISE